MRRAGGVVCGPLGPSRASWRIMAPKGKHLKGEVTRLCDFTFAATRDSVVNFLSDFFAHLSIKRIGEKVVNKKLIIS